MNGNIDVDIANALTVNNSLKEDMQQLVTVGNNFNDQINKIDAAWESTYKDKAEYFANLKKESERITKLVEALESYTKGLDQHIEQLQENIKNNHIA